MADNLDPRQIDNLTDAINKLTETLGGEKTIKKESVTNLEDFGKQIKNNFTDFRNLTKGVQMASSALGTLASGVDGVSRYNDAIESTGETIAKMGAMIGMLVGGPIGLLVAGVGAAVYATAKYTKAVNKQADDLYKSYQDISRAGVVGAQGVTDIFNNMQKLGYGVEELGKMGALLHENAENLAQFSGSAIDGTKTLANMSKGLNDSGLSQEFLRLGISIDQQNRGMAGYLKIQTMTGQAGLKTQEQLTKAAADYISEQDRLTKLTGMSAQKQQEVLERAQSEERLGATLRDLRRKGDDESLKKAAELEKAYKMAEGLPGLQKGIADAAAGFFTSKEAQQMLVTMPEAATQFGEASFSADKFFKSAAKGAEENNKAFDGLRSAVGDTTALMKGGELAQVQSRYNKSLEERTAAVDKERNAAIKGADAATANLVKNEVQQRKSRDDTQKALQAGIAPVTGFSAAISKGIATVTGIPGKVAPSLAPARQPPGTGPGGSLEDATKSLKSTSENLNKVVTPGIAGLGKVAAQFESGGKAGMVSTGHGDLGGKSYGAFQLSSKTGDVDKFLEKSGYGKMFEGMKVGSAEFDKKWKELGATDSKFSEAQSTHAKGTHYDPQMAKLKGAGIDLSGKGLGVQEAIMSTANQYGANTKMIQQALEGKDTNKMSDKEIINAIQDLKASKVQTSFRSSSENVRAGVAKRIEAERAALLAVQSPGSGYQATVAGTNPTSMLPGQPPSTTGPGGAATPQDTQTALFSQMLDKLDSIAKSTNQQASTTKKMLATQS